MRTDTKGTNLTQGSASGSETLATFSANTLVEVVAVTDNKYKVALPDGNYGFITSSLLNSTEKSLKQMKLSTDQPLLDKPDSQAAKRAFLSKGETVKVIGNYGDYYYVNAAEDYGWILSVNGP
jgi:SH3-like domain-containing protein